jgi:hypothetical protein
LIFVGNVDDRYFFPIGSTFPAAYHIGFSGCNPFGSLNVDIDTRETTQSKAGIDKYMLSGCELIDIENISLPSQNMKLAGE